MKKYNRKFTDGTDKIYEAIGWAYADCCTTLDAGEDPRKTEMGGVIQRAVKDLGLVIEAEQWHKVTYDRDVKTGRAITLEGKGIPIYHLGVDYYRTPELDGQDKCKHCSDIMHNHGWIDSLGEGETVCPGDWIIKGVSELCKPDIFEQTYEKVE